MAVSATRRGGVSIEHLLCLPNKRGLMLVRILKPGEWVAH